MIIINIFSIIKTKWEKELEINPTLCGRLSLIQFHISHRMQLSKGWLSYLWYKNVITRTLSSLQTQCATL